MLSVMLLFLKCLYRNSWYVCFMHIVVRGGEGKNAQTVGLL